MQQMDSEGFSELAFNQSAQAGDDQLMVRFMMKPRRMHEESEKAGRPIFKDTEYVEIRQPGNKDNVVLRPARQKDKDRFPEHYRKFKAREEQTVDGTPLEEAPWLTRSQCEELKFLGILTVEHLANLSDANGQNIMGISALKRKANQYIEWAENAAQDAKLKEELALRDEQLAAQQQEIEELKAAVAEMSKPKRRGRPKKEDQE